MSESKSESRSESRIMKLPPLRVLSMWNPWAFLTLFVPPGESKPAKEWETRHFIPRQLLPIPVAIHATKRDETRLLREEWPFRELLDAAHLHEEGDGRSKGGGSVRLGGGSIIGIAEIVDCRDSRELVNSWNHKAGESDEVFMRRAREVALGNYKQDERVRYGWQLAHAWGLPQGIPFKGKQDVLYMLPEIAHREIESQLYLCDVARWRRAA